VFKLELPKTKKTLLIVGACMLLFALVYRIFPTLQNLWGTSDDIGLKERQLAKYRKMVHGGDELEVRLASLRNALKQGESGLLTGKTPSLAAADIQNSLRDIATKSNVEINTVGVLKPAETKHGNYIYIPVQLTVTSTIRTLTEFLYGIESSPKYLTVKKVKIRVVSRRKSEQIKADITIYGLLKKRENQDTGGPA